MLSTATTQYGVDVSSWNPKINTDYQEPFVILRSNDGTYRDRDYWANIATVLSMLGKGRLAFWGTYFVWETNWADTVGTFLLQVGRNSLRPRMFVSIDVENWGGKITGDHSAGINAAREAIIAHLNGLRPRGTRRLMRYKDRRRVLIYGNAGDLATIAPHVGDAGLIVADWDGPSYMPRQVLQQVSDRAVVPPFGPCDLDRATGVTIGQLAKRLGVSVSRQYLARHRRAAAADLAAAKVRP